mmetsp:Transcript_25475/g.101522  ORF Transcript_25475/g.101522 Transcript_25475/m.101522 type:complete len:240 (-) Transcript_25475:135-854(-)
MSSSAWTTGRSPWTVTTFLSRRPSASTEGATSASISATWTWRNLVMSENESMPTNRAPSLAEGLSKTHTRCASRSTRSWIASRTEASAAISTSGFIFERSDTSLTGDVAERPASSRASSWGNPPAAASGTAASLASRARTPPMSRCARSPKSNMPTYAPASVRTGADEMPYLASTFDASITESSASIATGSCLARDKIVCTVVVLSKDWRGSGNSSGTGAMLLVCGGNDAVLVGGGEEA